MSALTSLVGLALTVGGIAIFPYTALLARRRREAMTWPRLQGRIVQSEVAYVAASEGGDPSGSVPRIRYQYVSGGQPYESDRIQWGPQVIDATDAGAQALVSRYPMGSTVQVLVNPRNPQESALQIAPEKGAWSYYGLGVVLSLVGLVLLGAS